MGIAYVCNRYPAVSMTFVAREVQALRALGVHVETFSIRAGGAADALSAHDRDEQAATFAVLPIAMGALARAHVRAFSRSPRRYLRTFAFSLRLGSGGARAALWRLFYFAEAMVVWDRCERRGLRHLHAHFANVATDVAMLCCHFADAPRARWSWSFTLHGPVEFHDVHRARLSEKIARARFVICISDYARSQAMAWCEAGTWGKLHVVHCGVDPSAWAPRRRETRPSQERLRVLCVGRLIALKGHAIALQAIARLRAEGLDVELTLIGDGEQRERLRALAHRLGVADLVKMPGAIGQDEIQGYFAAADVLCLPSFAEGVPVVLMEAMAMELAVLSTRIAGIPELVEDGVSGLLVAPGRADALAAQLRRLAESPTLRASFGRAGRERVLSEFDVAASGARLATLLLSYEAISSAEYSPAPGGVSFLASRRAPASPALAAVMSSSPIQNAGPPSGSGAVST